MSKRMLVDTHALLWWFTDPDLLSEPAARAMVDADGLLISPISFWEVATLVTKGRIELDRPTATWAPAARAGCWSLCTGFAGRPGGRRPLPPWSKC